MTILSLIFVVSKTSVSPVVPSIDLLSVDVLADTTNAEWRSKTAKERARKVELADCSFAAFGIPLPEHFMQIPFQQMTKWVAHDR
jgi:hypothetical protein